MPFSPNLAICSCEGYWSPRFPHAGQFLCVLLLSLPWCAQTDDMTESASAYFAEGQKSLASSCDIVLVLDDGVRLPAHSHVLARLLSLFSDMLDEGPLCRASRDSPVEVPLSECSTNEAIHFLSVLYPVNGSKSRGAPHLSTARLAHKYGTQVIFVKGYLYPFLPEQRQCLWDCLF